jgi:hypothetical protein
MGNTVCQSFPQHGPKRALNRFWKPMCCLLMETYFSNESGKRKCKQQRHHILGCEFYFLTNFSVIVSIFLLHKMYRRIHRQNYAYTFIHTVFILSGLVYLFIHSVTHVTFYIEFLACKNTRFCHSCTHETKRWADLCQYSAHLVYCGVQLLPQYPRIGINLKKDDNETMPLLTGVVLQYSTAKN